MAPANRPFNLAKIKTRESINPEADSFYVTVTTPALASSVAVQGSLKLTTNAGCLEKCLDSLLDTAEEGGENCQTPKLQEHNIPPVLCCPPAPVKRRSIPVKRKLPASSLERFYVLSDSDLHFLFGSDLATKNIVPKCLK